MFASEIVIISNICNSFLVKELQKGITVDGNTIFKDMEIGAIKGDKVYVLTYEAGMNEYDKYLPIIQESINSFQITK